jgi:Tol biopolymer transport system component
MNVHSDRRAVATVIVGAITGLAMLVVHAGTALAAYPGVNGKIAYLALATDVSDPPAEHVQVFTASSNGGSPQQLTHDDTGNADHPVFSPDGSKIAYVNSGGHIVVMDANGSNPVDLTPGDHADVTYGWPTWSPDGTKLAVEYRNQADATPEYDISVISSTVPGNTVTKLTAGTGEDSTKPAWSPDGTKIAFDRQQSAAISTQQVWLMSSTGSNPHAITNLDQDALAPAWSPDAKKILFNSYDLNLYTTDPGAASPGQTQLTNTLTFADRNADFSPDGTKIVEEGTSPSGNTYPNIYVLNATGGGATRITSGTYADEPSWQPTTADALTVTSAGTGSGTVTSSPAGINCPGTCSFPYAPGTKVTLTAAAGAGAYFAGWNGGGCSGTGTCTITLAAATTVTATFNTGVTLTVKNQSGLGAWITSTPSGISCDKDDAGTCSEIFAPGTFVTLHQDTYQDGALFTGWIGGGCSGIDSCTVVMTGNVTVSGTWTYVQPRPSGIHSVAPLAFTAPAQVAYVGTEWTGFATAIDCPSSSLCVTAGYMTDSATIAHKGIVITNTQFNHTSGWSAGVPDPDFNWAPPGDQWQLTAISCAGTSFCGAVDDQGDVFTTTNPFKGADTFGPNPQGVWQKTQNIDPLNSDFSHYTLGISCPSANVCGIIDADGGLVYSTNVAGGAGTWTRIVPRNGSSLTDISCPSPASCYATDASGNVLKSLTASNSTTSAFAGTWQAMAVDPGGELDHITCVQADCFAVDEAGDIWSSTNPSGGASAWKRVNFGSQLFTGISCSSPSFCVAVDNNGEAFVSKNPTGSASDWTSGSVLPSHGLDGISCASALVHSVGTQTWCVGISYDGNYVVGMIPQLSVSRPGQGSGSVVSSPGGITCPSSCGELVSAGTTVTLTATPASGSAFSTWSSNCPATQSQPLTCSVKVDQPPTTQVAAVFSPSPVSGSGGITIGGGTGTTTIQCTSKLTCAGTIVVSGLTGKLARARKPSKPAVIGKGTFHIKPHKRGVVRIHLTAAGKRLAKHRLLHRVTETITTKQPKHKKLITIHTVTVRY